MLLRNRLFLSRSFLGLLLALVGWLALTHNHSTLASDQSANWHWLNPQPQGNSLSRIECPDQTRCISAGAQGTILISPDGGQTWQVTASGTINGLYGLDCPTTGICYAVGEAGTILKSVDSGQHWTAQNSGTTTQLLATSCPSAERCYATGQNGLILATTNGGANWVSQTSNTDKALAAISCGDSNRCVAVGPVGTISHTNDGGASWSSVSQGAFGNSSVSCPAALVCYVVGVDYGRPADEIYKSTDGGQTWTRLQTNSRYNVSQISCPDVDHCFILAASNFLTTSDGGANFTLRSPVGTNYNGQSLNCPTTSLCLMAGYGGTIYRSTDGGQTWSLRTPGPRNHLSNLVCPGLTTCYMTGELNNVFKTSDGGLTLTPTTPASDPTGVISALSCPSSLTCYAADEINKVIARTGDGGQTWTSHPLSPDTNNSRVPYGLSCPDAATCYAAGVDNITNTGFILKSSDSGATWHTKLTGSLPRLKTIFCPDSDTCYALTSYPAGGIIKTTGGGTGWVSQYNDNNNTKNIDLYGLHCASSTFCMAVGIPLYPGTNPVVVKTGDGQNWSPAAGDLPQSISLYGVSCPQAQKCFVVGYSGAIYKTPDGGQTWRGQSSGTNNLLDSVACPASNTCLASGELGTLLTNALIIDPAQADDGSGQTGGTFSFALQNTGSGDTILLKRGLIKIGGSGPLAPLNPGVRIVSQGCGATMLDGQNRRGGLQFGGNNLLYGVKLVNFTGPTLNVRQPGNQFVCVGVGLN